MHTGGAPLIAGSSVHLGKNAGQSLARRWYTADLSPQLSRLYRP